MAPLPVTGSNLRSMAMQFTQVAYGGCWKCPHAWQRCSASTPCLAASQKGFVHSFGTGIGLVTLLQSLIPFFSSPCASSSVLHQDRQEPVGGARSVQAIDAPCGAAEQSGLFVDRRRCGDALERVPQGGISDPHLVDGKIAFEGAALRPEKLAARLDVRSPKGRQLVRGRGGRQLVVVVGGEPHHHAAELHGDV